MAHIEIETTSAQELHDLARATYVFISHSGGIGCTQLGENFHLFDYSGRLSEVKLGAKQTSPERLQAHLKGYLQNAQAIKG